MFHLPTLLFTLVLMDALLASTMWAAIGTGRRQGLVPWLLALAAQALMFGTIALRGDDNFLGHTLFANVMAAVSLTLQAEAILRFFNRRLPPWVHGAAPVAMLGVIAALHDWDMVRIAVAGVAYGCAMIALSILTHRLREAEVGLGPRLLTAGFAAGGAVLFARAGVALAAPHFFDGDRAGGFVPTLTVMFAFAITFLCSLGFLLSHRERHERMINHLAMVDGLTGIFNRRTFFNLASMALSHSIRVRSPVSLLLVDLDHFKRVNDAYGHQAGDAVLQRFVEVVQATLRKEDIFARYGGEEFCVLVPSSTPLEARTLAERIREAVEKAPYEFAGQWIGVTVSIGVATLHPAETRVESLLRRADEALYIAKRDGRNRVMYAP